MKRALAAFALAALMFAGARGATAATASATPIELAVDAREVARRILHVREVLPVSPGVVTLAYPRWIPGDHGPTGPMVDVAGIRIECGGATLPWKRDPFDMTIIRCTVPRAQRSLTLTFDMLLASDRGGYMNAHCATEHLLLLSWNLVLFAPAGARADATPFHAALTLPDGWRSATVLTTEASEGARTQYAPVSLAELVESPVLAGRHYRHFDLAAPDAPPVSLDIVCDSEAGLAFDDSLVEAHRRLVREARWMFGGTHYRQYRFLVSLSDHVTSFGLEHAECSDDRMPERAWVDDDARLNDAGLLAHEYAHSWNGKHRMPAGLATPNFSAPMNTRMLWVYEGLTNYLGWLLAARSGLRTMEESRAQIALAAAQQEYTRGRDWRPIEDTATDADALYEARGAWSSWRRGTDFYDDAMLVWLDVDATIRRLTDDQGSLDHFCHRFFGGTGAPEVKTYTFADLCAALNGVARHDWEGFFRTRIETVQPHADVTGFEQLGWRLDFADSTTSVFDARESAYEMLDETWSIGLSLDAKDGRVADVIPGSAADKAGVAPDMKLLGVNGRRWSADVLHDAIAATAKGQPIELLLENGEFLRAFRLDYSGGRLYPRLVRNDFGRDRLSGILRTHFAH